MTKKEQILNDLDEGLEVEEIVAKGFASKKYVQSIRREWETSQGKISNGVSYSKSNQNSKSFDDIEQALGFLQKYKHTVQHIEVSIHITLGEVQKTEAVKKKEIKKEEVLLNPIEYCKQEGAEKLKERLLHLEVKDLKSICKKYTPDPRGYAYKWKNKQKVADYICERAYSLSQKGNVFVT